jgi:hypothetical protein
LRLPGGGVSWRGSSVGGNPRLQEETGLIVAVADVVSLMEHAANSASVIFEVQLDAEPELTVDHRESSMLASIGR